MPALINATAIPRYSFDNLAISCFPNVWIHSMYDNTRFILRQSTFFSCDIDISNLHASLNRINTVDSFIYRVKIKNWQIQIWRWNVIVYVYCSVWVHVCWFVDWLFRKSTYFRLSVNIVWKKVKYVCMHDNCELH